MYSFDSRIRYSETDSEGSLAMAALINYFQDCSTFQSEELGVGVEYLKGEHLVWVLSSWQIVVERYPKLCEKVTIGTKPYDMKGFLGYRNFFMLDEDGRYLAKANSLWSLLDTRTGRPVAASDWVREKYALEEKLDMEYAPRRIAIPKEGEYMEPIVVRKHHLDTNHHVNNQQFVDMAMEYLPESFVIGQIRAEYKKQAFLGDELIPRVICEKDSVLVSLDDRNGAAYMLAEFLRKE